MRMSYLLCPLAWLVMGCERTPEPTPPPAVSAAVTSSSASTTASAPAPEKRRGEKRSGGKKAPLVYLDGALVGALRRAELPPSFEPKMVVRGKPFPVFPLAGYLEAVGADLDAVREVHLVGGRRTAVLAGDELRRVRNQLHFAFTKRDRGKARMDWPDAPIQISTRIDVISAVYAYQRREAPKYDRQKGTFSFDDGVAIEGVPYADHPRPPRGTRLYLDGRLKRALRKRDTTAPESLASLLETDASIWGVDLVGRDETIQHRSGPTWREGLSWTLDEGRLTAHLQTPDGERTSELSAVQVYAKVRPRASDSRPLPSN